MGQKISTNVPSVPSVPKTKESSARLRVASSQLPRVNTQRFKDLYLLLFIRKIQDQLHKWTLFVLEKIK